MKEYTGYVGSAFVITLLLLVVQGIAVWIRSRKVWQSLLTTLDHKLDKKSELARKS